MPITTAQLRGGVTVLGGAPSSSMRSTLRSRCCCCGFGAVGCGGCWNAQITGASTAAMRMLLMGSPVGQQKLVNDGTGERVGRRYHGSVLPAHEHEVALAAGSGVGQRL